MAIYTKRGTRYCLGRMTYIAGVCTDWLVDKWPELPRTEKCIQV